MDSSGAHRLALRARFEGWAISGAGVPPIPESLVEGDRGVLWRARGSCVARDPARTHRPVFAAVAFDRADDRRG